VLGAGTDREQLLVRLARQSERDLCS
ncbi:uncharacterized protein METZ01_LOCUS373816, partial [marine metagenome]